MSNVEDVPNLAPQASAGIGHNSTRAKAKARRTYSKRPSVKEKPITEAELIRACETVSLIIEAYGDAYWPILDRLEKELESLRSRSLRLSKHKVSGRTIGGQRCPKQPSLGKSLDQTDVQSS